MNKATQRQSFAAIYHEYSRKYNEVGVVRVTCDQQLVMHIMLLRRPPRVFRLINNSRVLYVIRVKHVNSQLSNFGYHEYAVR